MANTLSYGWKSKVVPYFSPCSLSAYMANFRSSHGAIGSTVYVYSALPSKDTVYRVRIVKFSGTGGGGLTSYYYNTPGSITSATVQGTSGQFYAGFLMEPLAPQDGFIGLLLVDGMRSET